jgi:hypothetical protein
MARIVKGAKGPAVLIEPGDSCYSIAEELTGNADRWPELVEANPGRALSELGTFRDMIPGEQLSVPPTWIEYAKSKGIPIVSADAGDVLEHVREERAAAGDVVTLPLYWTQDDVRIANAMGAMWGGTGDDVLVTLYQETAGSMNPHITTDFGGAAPDGLPVYQYGGLIAGLGSFWDGSKRIYPLDQSMGWPSGTWLKIVKKSSLSVQLQAIAQIWDHVFKTYIKGETIDERAKRFGVPLHAMIHAMNFLPARASTVKDAESPLTKSPENFYRDNVLFDVNKDGAITIRDMADFGDRQLEAMANGSKGTLLAQARSLRVIEPFGSLATLWAPITSEWQDLTGKPPITTVGYGTTSRGFANVGVLIAIAILLGVVYWVWGRR